MSFNKEISSKDQVLLSLSRAYGTPLYVFSEEKIRARCRELKAVLSYPHFTLRYACKALSIGAILRIIRSEGYSVDTSSFNEIQRCLHAGFPANEILFTGEGADREEFRKMIELGIKINCSSLDQMQLVADFARGYEVSLRFNPGQGHGHHQKVNTGGPHSKHGIYISEMKQTFEHARALGLKVIGVHTHIGSGTDLAHWLTIKDLTLEIARNCEDLRQVDLGGGFPVVYDETKDSPMPLTQWGKALSESMRDFSKELNRDIELQLEPGRFLVADSGELLAEIQAFKETPAHNFAIVNTGFNHNPRPVTYGAFHPIHFVVKDTARLKKSKNYVIAGNLCESGDVFTVNEKHELAPRSFPELAVGDLMVMGKVGAYSHAMMSEYNSMSLPASVMVHPDGSHTLIERRGTFEDLIRREIP